VLRRMFIRGEIAEGMMLPPESELMERFGVSRPTLREAFRGGTVWQRQSTA